jgi:hypothetical protein
MVYESRSFLPGLVFAMIGAPLSPSSPTASKRSGRETKNGRERGLKDGQKREERG